MYACSSSRHSTRTTLHLFRTVYLTYCTGTTLLDAPYNTVLTGRYMCREDFSAHRLAGTAMLRILYRDDYDDSTLLYFTGRTPETNPPQEQSRGQLWRIPRSSLSESAATRERERSGDAISQQQQHQRQHQHLAAKRVQLLRHSLRRHIVIERQINAPYGLQYAVENSIRAQGKRRLRPSACMYSTGKATKWRSRRLSMHFMTNVKATIRKLLSIFWC